MIKKYLIIKKIIFEDKAPIVFESNNLEKRK